MEHAFSQPIQVKGEKMQIKISLTLIALIPSIALASTEQIQQDEPTIPLCYAPPQDASPATEFCYDHACKKFRDTWNDC
ncbi:MAG: hypothetical protein NXI07_04115, partial [bacterium]|nr:hypothetical protein [bacterium]